MDPLDIPDVVIRRLPRYLRALTLLDQQGHIVASSQELGKWLGISPAQIRKDLSYFGEFGKQGMGYEVRFLRTQLERILQVDRQWDMVLVGAGDLGHAVVHYEGFKQWGFNIVAIFDNDPQKIGQRVEDLTVRDVKTLSQFVSQRTIKFGIITVPASNAQKVAEALVAGGVQAILSYAPITLSLPPTVRVHYIEPVLLLQSMAYYIDRNRDSSAQRRK